MRARNVKPSLFKNEVLGEADPLLTLLFVGLWCLADREGRLEDRPRRIKAELFPYRETMDVNRYLTVLSRLDFIRRFEVGNRRLIQIRNFAKHQHPHHTEKSSELPPPPEESTPCDDTVIEPSDNGEEPVTLRPLTDSLLLIPDLKKPPKSPLDKRPEIPDWLNADAWDAWLTHRREIRHAVTPSQARKQWAKLDRLRADGHDPADVIEHSIAGGYQGLFAPDKERKHASDGRYETAHARVRRLNGGEQDADPGSAGADPDGSHGATVDQDGNLLRR